MLGAVSDESVGRWLSVSERRVSACQGARQEAPESDNQGGRKNELTSYACVGLLGRLAQQGVAKDNRILADLGRIQNSWGCHLRGTSLRCCRVSERGWRRMLEGQGIEPRVWAGNRKWARDRPKEPRKTGEKTDVT